MIDISEGIDVDWTEDRLWTLDWMMGATNTYDGLIKAWEIFEEQGRGDVKVMRTSSSTLSFYLVLGVGSIIITKYSIAVVTGNQVCSQK